MLMRALVIAAIALAALGGYTFTAALCEAEQQRQRADVEAAHREGLQRAITQAEAVAREDAEVLFAAATEAQAREQRIRTGTRIATRVTTESPDDLRCRLDDCRLCLARAAAADTDPARCPCSRDGHVPAATAAGTETRSAAGLHRSRRAVQPVPSAPSIAE